MKATNNSTANDLNKRARARKSSISRRLFLGKSLAIGAGTIGVGALASVVGRPLPTPRPNPSKGLTAGDAALLRFPAALELLEADFWIQYNELGGIQDSEVPGGSGNEAYTEALEVLDEDMPQYIHDNTDDEFSHARFLNAFLVSIGEQPVNFDAFRTLPSSQATGARQIGRLTNLMHLNVDTSWYLRYRSARNPDFGFNFPQLIIIANRPAIPPMDLPSGSDAIQAIANTAAFHFAAIEQGGSSLYTTLALKVTNETVLRIVISIGG